MKPKKAIKKTRKAFEDFFEELGDFLGDVFKFIYKKRLKKGYKKLRKIDYYGASIMVRPAYVFAERLDNFFKALFGLCILVSGLIASFWGFTRLQDLLDFLILTITGRIIIIVIGICYLILGLWKLINIKESKEA